MVEDEATQNSLFRILGATGGPVVFQSRLEVSCVLDGVLACVGQLAGVL